MNTALEYSTSVVQEGGRRGKKSTLNDLVHLTPLRIPLMNPPQYLISPQRNTGGVASLPKFHIWETITKIGLPKMFRYSNNIRFSLIGLNRCFFPFSRKSEISFSQKNNFCENRQKWEEIKILKNICWHNGNNNFFSQLFLLILLSFFRDKKSERSHKTEASKFFFYFCLMIEGSWAGSVPHTNGSGSGKPKNIRIPRIRICNTATQCWGSGTGCFWASRIRIH